MLAPGNSKTKTGRFWGYLRDERSHAGAAPPAVLYRYTPDRKGEHCRDHLASFAGHLHADGYSGFAELYRDKDARPASVAEAACWAHVRRKFFDVHTSNGSPIAKEALDKIGALFDIERTAAGKPPGQHKVVRMATAKPKLDALADWFDEQLKLISGKSDLAKAIRYARSRWQALTCYCADRHQEISNNAAENQIRPLTMTESLCTSCLSGWNLFFGIDPTRAVFSRKRGDDMFAIKVSGPDLMRRIGHDLPTCQYASLD